MRAIASVALLALWIAPACGADEPPRRFASTAAAPRGQGDATKRATEPALARAPAAGSLRPARSTTAIPAGGLTRRASVEPHEGHASDLPRGEPPPVVEEQFKSITSLSLRIAPPAGDHPASAAEAVFASRGVIYPPAGFFFDCLQHGPCENFAAFCHPPLYFEDACLERCGASGGSDCVQSALSAARFYAGIAALPYKMCVDPPCRPVCHCRRCCCSCDGSCGELQWDAALFEAALVGGLILAIP